eukprot:scaffold1231_cov187-Pinguiococcus_pyrenoidosus.AAC.10
MDGAAWHRIAVLEELERGGMDNASAGSKSRTVSKTVLISSSVLPVFATVPSFSSSYAGETPPAHSGSAQAVKVQATRPHQLLARIAQHRFYKLGGDVGHELPPPLRRPEAQRPADVPAGLGHSQEEILLPAVDGLHAAFVGVAIDDGVITGVQHQQRLAQVLHSIVVRQTHVGVILVGVLVAVELADRLPIEVRDADHVPSADRLGSDALGAEQLVEAPNKCLLELVA